jgi:hypothetical protein
MYKNTLEKWHAMLETRDPSGLADLLADDVVFYSPVVWSPQQGKPLTQMYLQAAFHVLVNETFTYVKKTYAENSAILEFSVLVDDTTINGVDIISFNPDGLIVEFKVMVRPLQGMNKLHQKMGELLETMKSRV